MNSYRDIIDSPIITEKSATLEPNGTYVFKVNIKANKTQIKQAIEKIFNVKVAKITTTLITSKEKKSWSLYWYDQTIQKSLCYIKRRIYY